jgi:hypothetical protein
VRVIYLDETGKAGCRFQVLFGQGRHAIDLDGCGEWKTAEFTAEGPLTRELAVLAGDQDVCLHMVEILRVN